VDKDPKGDPATLTRAAVETYIEPDAMMLKTKFSTSLFLPISAAVILGLAAASGGAPIFQAVDLSLYRPASGDIVRPEGLPEIGCWMLGSDLVYAHWMNEIYEGKRLREPVNIIVSDAYARDEQHAVGRLLGFCFLAGFTSRAGHSSGYFGWLGGKLFSQIPSVRHHCLADGPFELNNNHGRFFGPVRQGREFFFIGALSRERISPFIRAKHGYLSFNQARDAFADALSRRAGFTIRADIALQNAVLGDPRVGTGDHDGIAVWLSAPTRSAQDETEGASGRRNRG
jgi:hypothetical protein